MSSKKYRENNREAILAYQREWYKNNSERQKQFVRNREAKLLQWFREYKEALCCTICGEDHPACLDFHHRDPNEKEMEISTALSYGWSKERILVEIEKCDILCSNCHRKLHWDEKNAPIV